MKIIYTIVFKDFPILNTIREWEMKIFCSFIGAIRTLMGPKYSENLEEVLGIFEEREIEPSVTAAHSLLKDLTLSREEWFAGIPRCHLNLNSEREIVLIEYKSHSGNSRVVLRHHAKEKVYTFSIEANKYSSLWEMGEKDIREAFKVPEIE